MSEQQQTEDLEALKARITELEAENEKLKTTMTEATKTLTAYVEKEREASIKAILEKTTLSKDELEKLDLAQLRLIRETFSEKLQVFMELPRVQWNEKAFLVENYKPLLRR